MAGLQHLHSNGILFCDLKPANILLDECGSPKVYENVQGIYFEILDNAISFSLPTSASHARFLLKTRKLTKR